MATDVQVTCIRRDTNSDPDFSIDRIGGPAQGGGYWTRSLAEAIAHVEAKVWNLFTEVGGVRAQVIVASRNGRKYLTTSADGTKKNNLLSLPTCP